MFAHMVYVCKSYRDPSALVHQLPFGIVHPCAVCGASGWQSLVRSSALAHCVALLGMVHVLAHLLRLPRISKMLRIFRGTSCAATSCSIAAVGRTRARCKAGVISASVPYSVEPSESDCATMWVCAGGGVEVRQFGRRYGAFNPCAPGAGGKWTDGFLLWLYGPWLNGRGKAMGSAMVGLNLLTPKRRRRSEVGPSTAAFFPRATLALAKFALPHGGSCIGEVGLVHRTVR